MSVRRGKGVAQPETRLALLCWLAIAPHFFFLSLQSSLSRFPWFCFRLPPPSALSHLFWLYSQRMPSIFTIETASKPLLQKPFLWKETKKAMADF
jgi:hypothetical protein